MKLKHLSGALCCALVIINKTYTDASNSKHETGTEISTIDNSNAGTYIGPYPLTYIPKQDITVTKESEYQKIQEANQARKQATQLIHDYVMQVRKNQDFLKLITTLAQTMSQTSISSNNAYIPVSAPLVTLDYELLTEKLLNALKQLGANSKFTYLLRQIIQTVYLEELKDMQKTGDNYADTLQTCLIVFKDITGITIDKTTGRITLPQIMSIPDGRQSMLPPPTTFLAQPTQQQNPTYVMPNQQAITALKESIYTTLKKSILQPQFTSQLSQAITTLTHMTAQPKKAPGNDMPTLNEKYYDYPIAMDYTFFVERFVDNFKQMSNDPKLRNLLEQIIPIMYQQCLQATQQLDERYVNAFKASVTMIEYMTGISIHKTTGRIMLPQLML